MASLVHSADTAAQDDAQSVTTSLPIETPCLSCGKHARVRRLAGYAHGMAHHDDLCLACYQRSAGTPLHARRPRLRAGTLIGLLGIMLGCLVVLGEWILPLSQAGFGQYQKIAVVISAMCVLIGAISRTDIIALVGSVLFVAVLTVDWVASTHAAGLGWKQQLGLAVALAFVVFALWDRWGRSLFKKLHKSSRLVRAT